MLCGLAPNLNVLLFARVLQGIAGGPLMPLSQAIMWEIFPFRQRGMAMAVWGMGIMMAPIFGPTLGGWITDNWSWRWTFYINVPIGILGFFAASAILFDPPYLRKPGKIDIPGLVLMVIGFLSLQLFLDQGERYEWFDSTFIVALGLTAAVALVGFLVRELTAEEPILDLGVYRDRNFAAASLIMVFVMFGFFSSMVLLALFTQKVLGYDAWTSGLVLAPGRRGQSPLARSSPAVSSTGWISGFSSAVGCVLNALGGLEHVGAHQRRGLLGAGVAALRAGARRRTHLRAAQRRRPGHDPADQHGQCHRAAERGPQPGRRRGGGHGQHAADPADTGAPVDADRARQSLRRGDGGAPVRLDRRTSAAQGADSFTAQRRALAMVYQEVTRQAQVLAFADDFWLLFVLFCGTLLLLPLLERVRTGPASSRQQRAAPTTRPRPSTWSDAAVTVIVKPHTPTLEAC